MIDQAHNLRNMVEEKRKEKIKQLTESKDIKVYSITSGKGGVGKTNVVVNLAISLQKKGRKVLIIDADLGLANVDVVIGVYPKITLYDVLFENIPLKDAIIEGPEGVKIIPGGSGIMKMTSLDSNKQSKLAEEFFQLDDIDVILIDTGAGISMSLMSFIAFSQEVIIITTPEPTALTDAYSVIKVVSELKLKKKMNVIVNRASKKEIAYYTYEKLNNTVQNFLDISLKDVGYIIDDIRVSNSVMDRVPFIIQYPNSIASKCIDSISENLIEEDTYEIKLKTMSEVYNRLIKVFG